jgi:hypothetical protein
VHRSETALVTGPLLLIGPAELHSQSLLDALLHRRLHARIVPSCTQLDVTFLVLRNDGRVDDYMSNDAAVLKGTKAALVKVTKERNAYEALFKEACALAKSLEIENAKLKGRVAVGDARTTVGVLDGVFAKARAEGLPNSWKHDARKVVKG